MVQNPRMLRFVRTAKYNYNEKIMPCYAAKIAEWNWFEVRSELKEVHLVCDSAIF